MSESIFKGSVSPGDKVVVQTNKNATYELVMNDGTRVEFKVLAGQEFLVTAGQDPAGITILLKDAETTPEPPRLVQVDPATPSG